MLRRIPLLIALIAPACASAPIAATPAAAATAAVAATPAVTALPSMELMTLDGQPIQIAQALGGRPALVSLWATWCEACAAEFVPLARLSARASSMGAVVVAVAVGEPREKVGAFVREHALSYPQLVDEQFHFADGAGQKRVPATLVVDRDGRVVYSGGVLDAPALSALERVVTQPGRASAAR